MSDPVSRREPDVMGEPDNPSDVMAEGRETPDEDPDLMAPGADRHGDMLGEGGREAGTEDPDVMDGRPG